MPVPIAVAMTIWANAPGRRSSDSHQVPPESGKPTEHQQDHADLGRVAAMALTWRQKSGVKVPMTTPASR
ncbi:MAG: hypothetical protein IPN24_20670 [Betaproteobacteria bacterium]|nr:hypothetical protein [Betaproteobacteria bacterium]